MFSSLKLCCYFIICEYHHFLMLFFLNLLLRYSWSYILAILRLCLLVELCVRREKNDYVQRLSKLIFAKW